jgi:hypothetical protein
VDKYLSLTQCKRLQGKMVRIGGVFRSLTGFSGSKCVGELVDGEDTPFSVAGDFRFGYTVKGAEVIRCPGFSPAVGLELTYITMSIENMGLAR